MRKPPPVADQQHVGHTPYYPVMSYNGMVNYDLARSPGAFGQNHSPHLHRKWTNLGYNDVQIRNGLGRRIGSGQMFPYIQQMYVWAFIPRIPGQQRGDVGGFHTRGPSPYNVQDWFNAGPGSQPEHPGGPGQVVGSSTIFNPMSG
jgi:hypothetical protein